MKVFGGVLVMINLKLALGQPNSKVLKCKHVNFIILWNNCTLYQSVEGITADFTEVDFTH